MSRIVSYRQISIASLRSSCEGLFFSNHQSIKLSSCPPLKNPALNKTYLPIQYRYSRQQVSFSNTYLLGNTLPCCIHLFSNILCLPTWPIQSVFQSLTVLGEYSLISVHATKSSKDRLKCLIDKCNNRDNRKTAMNVIEQGRLFDPPCRFCRLEGLPCIKMSPKRRCAFCAAKGRSAHTCEGVQQSSRKRGNSQVDSPAQQG